MTANSFEVTSSYILSQDDDGEDDEEEDDDADEDDDDSDMEAEEYDITEDLDYFRMGETAGDRDNDFFIPLDEVTGE